MTTSQLNQRSKLLGGDVCFSYPFSLSFFLSFSLSFSFFLSIPLFLFLFLFLSLSLLSLNLVRYDCVIFLIFQQSPLSAANDIYTDVRNKGLNAIDGSLPFEFKRVDASSHERDERKE